MFRLMLLPIIMADVIANIASMLLWLMVIAKMSYLYYNHQCWYLYWQMLLPSGRWNSHLVIVLADVIAKWQMEWPLQGGVLADVIAMWQMEQPLGLIILSLSSEVLNRTSSHIWGRWYLPMFLFRMDYWPLCIELLLWLSWGSAPLFPQC